MFGLATAGRVDGAGRGSPHSRYGVRRASHGLCSRTMTEGTLPQRPGDESDERH